MVSQIATRIAVMRSGRLVEIGDAEHLLHHPNQQYTRDLLTAVRCPALSLAPDSFTPIHFQLIQ